VDGVCTLYKGEREEEKGEKRKRRRGGATNYDCNYDSRLCPDL